MDHLVARYTELYYQSPHGSPQEAAAFDVLCVCDGTLTPTQLQGKLMEAQAALQSAVVAGLASGTCQGLIGHTYYQQKIAVYEQFLALISSHVVPGSSLPTQAG